MGEAQRFFASDQMDIYISAHRIFPIPDEGNLFGVGRKCRIAHFSRNTEDGRQSNMFPMSTRVSAMTAGTHSENGRDKH
jgi:hypothetical protein